MPAETECLSPGLLYGTPSPQSGTVCGPGRSPRPHSSQHRDGGIGGGYGPLLVGRYFASARGHKGVASIAIGADESWATMTLPNRIRAARAAHVNALIVS